MVLVRSAGGCGHEIRRDPGVGAKLHAIQVARTISMRVALIGAAALIAAAMAAGFAIKTMLDTQPAKFEVVDTSANCPDLIHCTLIAHLRNVGGSGTGEVRLSASGEQRSGVIPHTTIEVVSLSCLAVIPRAQQGDLVEASCSISATRSPAPTFQNPPVTATIVR
jgi:hypothetical protein